MLGQVSSGKVPSEALCASLCESVSCSDSLRPLGLRPVRLLCPWNSPDKNTGVGCRFLLHRIFTTGGSNPGLLHCRWILHCLSHLGRLVLHYVFGWLLPSLEKDHLPGSRWSALGGRFFVCSPPIRRAIEAHPRNSESESAFETRRPGDCVHIEVWGDQPAAEESTHLPSPGRSSAWEPWIPINYCRVHRNFKGGR